MTPTAAWQESNARFLSAALAALRARLEKYAGREKRPLFVVEPPPPPPESKSLWGRLTRAEKPRPTIPPQHGDALEEPPPPSPDSTAIAGPPPALILLSQVLGLSQFEREVLLLCAATELDSTIGPLCAKAQRDERRTYPTLALALDLFDKPGWEAISPERPLRYWRLIEISQPAGQPLTTSALRADERIVSFLKGLNYLDDRLSPLMTPIHVGEDETNPPESQKKAVEEIARQLQQTPTGALLPVVQLLGSDGSSKELVAGHVVAKLGVRLYRIQAPLIPSQPSELETLARLWHRESLLLPVSLYVDALGSDFDAPSAGHSSPVTRLLERSDGLVFLDTREVWPGLPRASLTVDVSKPTSAEQRAAWSDALGADAGDAPARLAAQFNLGVSSIRRIAVQARADCGEESIEDAAWDACLANTRPRLDMLAQRLDPKATWDDIVLPAEAARLLHQIAAQVAQRGQVYQDWGFGQKMSRGLGISALFAGDPGTGKTMAAEVIANELRLNLYRIDLSAVVSKYIGETEKNLRRLFDAAEDGGAILFFDEADALFGKRSEVKDSHDRYANIEINYLLQRMEAYRGLAILATNMKSALDPAFMRRLRFVVNFPFPSVAERKAIWRKVFPPQAPAAGLDFDRLAMLNLTGGNIQSIALNAAFAAAQTPAKQVTPPIVVDAARTELRKQGRLVNELDFRMQRVSGGAA
jgi:hypothetical protein